MRGRAAPFVALAACAAAVAAVAAPSVRAISVPWCGSGEPTADLPDAVSAYEWHVVYALPDGASDRFAAFAPRFAGDAATLSSWWVDQDATRRPRFDLLDAPSCPNDYGRLDISLVRVAAGVTSYAGIVDAVRAAGLEDPDKGYLVYFDGSPHAGDEYGLCGQGSVDNATFAYSIVFLQTCNQAASDDARAEVATHEMAHGMGAVPTQAPHSCDNGHVCDSAADLMKATLGQDDILGSLTLDVGRDDYYGHTGSWWDMRDSGLLYDLDESLDPAPDVVGLTATDVAGVVRVDWSPSKTQPNLYYRIYDERGKLVQGDQETASLAASGSVGDVLTWTIRIANGAGFLSKPATLHYKIGYGIVDAAGALIKDTVRPAAVGRLRATVTAAKVVLRWPAVADPVGLRGYRVTVRDSAPFLVTGTTAALSRARARGRVVSVAAVDLAGNVGRAASLRVR